MKYEDKPKNGNIGQVKEYSEEVLQPVACGGRKYSENNAMALKQDADALAKMLKSQNPR